MRDVAAIERDLEAAPPADPRAAAQRLLALGEEILEVWIAARGGHPPSEPREGFRLLALHHEGARGVPSFNACRETCREIAYHYNLLAGGHGEAEKTVAMMVLLVRHLALFVGGKLQVEGLGEFCCASKPLRQDSGTMAAPKSDGESHA